MEYLLCSDCLQDQGLRLSAMDLGHLDPGQCRECGSARGKKLDVASLEVLAQRFFEWGTLHRVDYGGAPAIKFNEAHYSSSDAVFPVWLQQDARLISDALKVGFFHYGPRLWMLGEIEPLKALQEPDQRGAVIDRILAEYPQRILTPSDSFYRLRDDPEDPTDPSQYDSSPASSEGRLTTVGLPVLYASQDLEVCLHEGRVTVDDLLYLATLSPTRDLTILDLTHVLKESVSEFESLDLAVLMLFLSGKHSYPICREIARSAHQKGFDGLAFPSYFSLVRTGGMPFPTVYGISIRRFQEGEKIASSHTIPNLGLFGRPVKDGIVTVDCVNRVLLGRVQYTPVFGPASY